MPNTFLPLDPIDNGGRRRARDRRFMISAPCVDDRRTDWERRSGYDRRFRPAPQPPKERRESNLKR